MLWQCLACCMIKLVLRKCLGSMQQHGDVTGSCGASWHWLAKQLASPAGLNLQMHVFNFEFVFTSVLILIGQLTYHWFCCCWVYLDPFDWCLKYIWASLIFCQKILFLSEQLCTWLIPGTVCSFVLILNVMPKETTWATTFMWPFQSTSLKD